MAGNPLPSSRIVVPLILAFALFIGAIIARNFWLSLVLGLAGALTFAYAVLVLRESAKVCLTRRPSLRWRDKTASVRNGSKADIRCCSHFPSKIDAVVGTSGFPRFPKDAERPKSEAETLNGRHRNAMCRWLAYSGSPLLLEELLYKPEHSLIDQSLHARLGPHTTNGDGFGIGWYDDSETPVLYRGIDPAWNDQKSA